MSLKPKVRVIPAKLQITVNQFASNIDSVQGSKNSWTEIIDCSLEFQKYMDFLKLISFL